MHQSNDQQRIQELQNYRHTLLDRRTQRGAAVASIDMELNVVRSELQALYAQHRTPQPSHTPLRQRRA